MNTLVKYRLVKAASMISVPGNTNRRELSDREQDRVESAKGNILPKIFKSQADDISEDMHSPLAASLMAAIPGGLGGALLGKMVTADGKNPEGTGLGTALGSGTGALLSALLAHKLTDTGNRDLEEYMKYLPEGSTTRRNLSTDPAYANERAYKSMERGSGVPTALLAGALMGR